MATKIFISMSMMFLIVFSVTVSGPAMASRQVDAIKEHTMSKDIFQELINRIKSIQDKLPTGFFSDLIKLLLQLVIKIVQILTTAYKILNVIKKIVSSIAIILNFIAIITNLINAIINLLQTLEEVWPIIQNIISLSEKIWEWIQWILSLIKNGGDGSPTGAIQMDLC